MGGGNANKTMMARQKKMEKAAADKAGGGGAAGAAARKTDLSLVCSQCKQAFPGNQAKMAKVHVESKHPKSNFAECFPGVPEP